MIHYLTGNIFDSDAMALVNTVNLSPFITQNVQMTDFFGFCRN